MPTKKGQQSGRIIGQITGPTRLGGRPQGFSTAITAPGRFRMWIPGQDRQDPKESIHCLLGAAAPRVVRGYGGWGQAARTGRRALPVFEGSETVAYEVALLLENQHVPGFSVENMVRQLDRLSGLASVGSDAPPPVVRWYANAPHDYGSAPKLKWVCESLEWGESNYTDGGVLLWREATLTLAVFSDPQIKTSAVKGFRRQTLRPGQDLRDFARKWLGDAKRWRDVAELNRDNPACPTGPHVKRKKAVALLLPPREG